MKNEDLENYYTTVLAAAYINVSFIEVTGEMPKDEIIANTADKLGFNITAFLEDSKAFTEVILNRNASETKFNTPND